MLVSNSERLRIPYINNCRILIALDDINAMLLLLLDEGTLLGLLVFKKLVVFVQSRVVQQRLPLRFVFILLVEPARLPVIDELPIHLLLTAPEFGPFLDCHLLHAFFLLLLTLVEVVQFLLSDLPRNRSAQLFDYFI